MIDNRRTESAEQRPLSELFNDLLGEIGLLLRQEWQLARTEMTEKARVAGKSVGMLAAGGLIVYAGFLALLAALILGIAAAGLAWWLAALIVGVAVVIVGGALIYLGIDTLRRSSLAPNRTVQTLRDDARWLKEETQ